MPPEPSPALAPPLTLISTEGLEHPLGGGHGTLFVPTEQFPLEAESATQAVGFFVTVASTRADSIELEFVEPQNQKHLALARIARPSGEATFRAFQPDALTRQRLLDGEALFWREQAEGLQVRLGILLPERLLGRLSRLHILDTRDSTGNPVQYVHISLARRFFYGAIIGDSITWGNGLRNEDKFTTRIFHEAEDSFGAVAIVQQYAQSGAQISRTPLDQLCTVGCFGEVPTADSSILDQVGQIEHPELIQLVILNGCINDLGFPNIINPNTDNAALVDATRFFCDDTMRELLRAARQRMPNAWIVVTGYYPIVSLQTEIIDILQYVSTQASFSGRGGFAVTEEELLAAGALRDEAALQSQLFYEESAAALERAAAAVRAESSGGPPIVVVDPQFGPEHSIFAPDSMLWGTTRFTSLLEQITEVLQPRVNVFPEDDTLDLRLERCLEPEAIDGPFFCLYVSVGHPNRAGAQRYWERVSRTLREAGFFTR